MFFCVVKSAIKTRITLNRPLKYRMSKVNVDTINVKLSTNIPNQPDISLTKNLVVVKSQNFSKYNEYPYITGSIRIKPGYLPVSYADRMDFFFVKERFTRLANRMIRDNPIDTNYVDDSKTDDGGKTKFTENITANIKTLLSVMFTTFPIQYNLTDSMNRERLDANITLLDETYSYVNVNSKKYTVSRVVWINDIYNHFAFENLRVSDEEYENWFIREDKNLTNKLKDTTDERDVLLKSIKHDDIEGDINNVEQYIEKVKVAAPAPGQFVPENVTKYKMASESLGKSLTALKTMMSDNLPDNQKYIEFTIELNRALDIIIQSNMVVISDRTKVFVKDLYANVLKLQKFVNEQGYLKLTNLRFGNEKYKNEKYTAVTNKINENTKLIKKMINYADAQNVKQQDKYSKLVAKLTANTGETQAIKPIASADKDSDQAGLIFDNDKTPSYEIYIFMDLIDGVVTDENRNNLNMCGFKDGVLLNKFRQLVEGRQKKIIHDPLMTITAPSHQKPTVSSNNKTRKQAVPTKSNNTTRKQTDVK